MHNKTTEEAAAALALTDLAAIQRFFRVCDAALAAAHTRTCAGADDVFEALARSLATVAYLLVRVTLASTAPQELKASYNAAISDLREQLSDASCNELARFLFAEMAEVLPSAELDTSDPSVQ